MIENFDHSDKISPSRIENGFISNIKIMQGKFVKFLNNVYLEFELLFDIRELTRVILVNLAIGIILIILLGTSLRFLYRI